jgi:AraC-like DNA-binding protein
MMKDEFRILKSRIAGIQAVASDSSHVFSRHTHEQFGIGVIDRGAQKSHSGRGMVEAGAGDTITVNPGEVHDGSPIGDFGRSWRMLYLNPSLIEQLAHHVDGSQTKSNEFNNPVIRNAQVSNLFGELFATITSGDERDAYLRAEELLLMLLPATMRERLNLGQMRAIPVGFFNSNKYVDDDPVAHITLADLARESGLSQFQIVRAFVKATGLTPHSYIVQCRIDAARRLIAQGSSLAETAQSCGFADQSHMTRIFVRKYGVSPGAYAAAVNRPFPRSSAISFKTEY